jgi:hypothetical protein
MTCSDLNSPLMNREFAGVKKIGMDHVFYDGDGKITKIGMDHVFYG